ncbi:hypothetical protein [Klebsiella pneumoniae IS22]|nr:hypothetical protein [Klebsiella pneumoniae IS22]
MACPHQLWQGGVGDSKGRLATVGFNDGYVEITAAVNGADII